VLFPVPHSGRQEQPTGAAALRLSTNKHTTIKFSPQLSSWSSSWKGSYLGEILANYLRMFEYLSRQLPAGCSL